jgi:hypothetical protein
MVAVPFSITFVRVMPDFSAKSGHYGYKRDQQRRAGTNGVGGYPN